MNDHLMNVLFILSIFVAFPLFWLLLTIIYKVAEFIEYLIGGKKK